MRIAVLELTGHPLPLLEGLPRTSRQIIDWLKPHLPEAEFFVVDIVDGAACPAMGGFDGVIIGGSEYGVYDDLDWMQPLRRFLLDCKDAQKPMFGICFGHQIMADTFGGKAGKAEIGNVVGARLFGYRGKQVQCHVWHQDQVHQIPPDARVTGSADHCPIGALEYDFAARSVQFHPEYKVEHLRDLLERGRNLFVASDEVDAALVSFKGTEVPHNLAVSEAIALFRQPIT